MKKSTSVFIFQWLTTLFTSFVSFHLMLIPFFGVFEGHRGERLKQYVEENTELINSIWGLMWTQHWLFIYLLFGFGPPALALTLLKRKKIDAAKFLMCSTFIIGWLIAILDAFLMPNRGNIISQKDLIPITYVILIIVPYPIYWYLLALRPFLNWVDDIVEKFNVLENILNVSQLISNWIKSTLNRKSGNS